jgi:uncharacterized membrane protein
MNLDFSSIGSSLTSITNFMNSLIPLIISIGLILFLIGIVQFVTAGGDEEKRAAARGMIIFGIIALFVMVSVWGFVNILSKTFFQSGGTNTIAPDYIPKAIGPASGAVGR